MRRRIVKQLTLAVIAGGFVANADAVAPGFYLGLMGGPATNSGGTQQAQVQGSATTTPVTPKSKQFGSRLFMGYKINQYADIEGGLDYFSSVSYDTKSVETCSGATVRVRGLDVMGKGEVPVGAFSLYGKAGAALIYQSASGALTPDLSSECGRTTYSNKFVPTVAIGAGYDLSQNWVADISLTRLMVGNQLSNVDLFALGISYHFVDVYCGQFLC